jgi:hypothetical protein
MALPSRQLAALSLASVYDRDYVDRTTVDRDNVTDQLHRELWTSWASLLRSYAAVHSLGREQHAVVEVSDESITVRYGMRWARFTPSAYTTSQGLTYPFELTKDGRARVGDDEDEMDLCAERLASEIISL